MSYNYKTISFNGASGCYSDYNFFIRRFNRLRSHGNTEQTIKFELTFFFFSATHCNSQLQFY